MGNRVTMSNRAYGERTWNRGSHDRPIRMPFEQRFTNGRVLLLQGNIIYTIRGIGMLVDTRDANLGVKNNPRANEGIVSLQK